MKLLKELNVGKRANFKQNQYDQSRRGYYSSSGTILAGGMYSNNWSREDIKDAVEQIQKSPAFKNVEKRMPFISSVKELANGTLCFKSDITSPQSMAGQAREGDPYAQYSKDEYQVVKVYLGGQIRTQAYKNGKAATSSATRVASPKPKMIAGEPVKSAVSAYEGALEAVATRYDKMKAASDKAEAKKLGNDPMGTWHGRNY